MKRKFFIAGGLVALLFAAQAASAQSYSQGQAQAQTQQAPSQAEGPTGAQTTFGNGANGVPGTVDGSLAEGIGAMEAGAGQYNLNTALAVRALEDARSRYIANYRAAMEMRYAVKTANDQYRAQKFARERMNPELLSRVIQDKLPDRLSAGEYDPRNGALKWPAALMAPEFAADRAAINAAFAQRHPEDVGMTSIFYRDVSQRTQRMHNVMLQHLDQLSTTDSIAARKFLSSLEMEARHLPEQIGLASLQR